VSRFPSSVGLLGLNPGNSAGFGVRVFSDDRSLLRELPRDRFQIETFVSRKYRRRKASARDIDADESMPRKYRTIPERGAPVCHQRLHIAKDELNYTLAIRADLEDCQLSYYISYSDDALSTVAKSKSTMEC